ncbi:glycerol-3-phosphate dehydrogenase [Devosia sp.]|uniref:glycerol-3-phosphate dehydrogenase n=1 Tax=Devosia sp. TaxID=1871048 RepID=UPI003A936D2D
MTDSYDILVIGGGVNGTGIARDAAGRGYRVLLCEMNDLASGTSSAATKLVHGGLRYLEHYEFRLVREALIEREVLWASAPHIIWPLRFVLPHQKGLRPAWLLRLGLFLYDHLGGRKLLPGTKTLDLRTDPTGKPLKPGYRTGFEYSDGWVDDARLVALNARDAADRGAVVKVGTKVSSVRRDGDAWAIEMNGPDGMETARAKIVVNAAGPWVDAVIRQAFAENEAHHVRLVKGSHIVVNKLFDHDKCYFFQNPDGRIMFAIPYEGDYTLIGTTDMDFDGDPDAVTISESEIDYLCDGVSEYFAKPVTRADIVWTYSGVRPLYDDGATAAQEATRDYVLKTEGADGTPKQINVFGGKLTTSRRLSEEVVDDIGHEIGKRGAHWTHDAKLPGGDFAPTAFDAELAKLQKAYPGFAPDVLHRLLRSYGTLAPTVLGDAKSLDDMGETFGAGLTAREIDYMIAREWARAGEDVLWRRSKLGLRLDATQIARVGDYVTERLGGRV